MLTTANRKWREARMVARGLQSSRHPVLAQIVPIRRCNLACAYCNEFDNHSSPVPLDTMLDRIGYLARLGTTTIELSGGEPLLHPELDIIIRRIRLHGALAGLITNGYLLSPKRIERLNDALRRFQQFARAEEIEAARSAYPELATLVEELATSRDKHKGVKTA